MVQISQYKMHLYFKFEFDFITIFILGHHGHDENCVTPETFKLNLPVITSANLLKYKSQVLNALSVCSENMLFWEVKSAREKVKQKQMCVIIS